MVTKQRATAMVRLEKAYYPDVRMYYHKTSLDVPVENGRAEVISLAATISLTMKKHDKTMRIATVDGTTIESTRDIPNDSEAFNEYFKCIVITPSERRQYVQMQFVLHSKETFSKIKNENWMTLTINNLWLKLSPGPFKRTDLTLVGFLSKVSRHASLVSIHEEMKLEVKQGRVLDEEEEFPSEIKLDIFLHRSKITGELMTKRVVDNHATAIYVDKMKYYENSTLMEKYCKELSNNMRYIPMAIKRKSQNFLGDYFMNPLKLQINIQI